MKAFQKRENPVQRQDSDTQSPAGKSMSPPPFQLAGGKKGGNKDIDVTIAADTESEFLSREYREQGAVGHAWIKIKEPGKAEDSYGFWPANLGAGGGFDPSKPWKTVAGEVRNPDTSHTSKQEFTVKTDAEGLAQGLQYAGESASRNYNLLTYNCTSFARKFFKKSTGKTAPSAGFLGLAENPNWLADNIEKKNAKNAKKATKTSSGGSGSASKKSN